MSWLDNERAVAIAITTVQISTALYYGPSHPDVPNVEVEKEVMRTELELETQKFLEE